MALTASEVRKLTSESLKGPVIEPIIDVIDNAIIEQAKNGNSSLHNPMQVGDLRKSFSLNADVEKPPVDKQANGMLQCKLAITRKGLYDDPIGSNDVFGLERVSRITGRTDKGPVRCGGGHDEPG